MGIVDAVAEAEMQRFMEVANKVADAAGEVLRKYFRQSFEILDKEDLSPCLPSTHTPAAPRAKKNRRGFFNSSRILDGV